MSNGILTDGILADLIAMTVITLLLAIFGGIGIGLMIRIILFIVGIQI